MKIHIVIVVGWLGMLSGAFSQNSSVEGTVTLPLEISAGSATPARYEPGVNPAPPEGPSAIVYLEGLPVSEVSSNAPPMELFQKGFQFMPRLMAVQKGTAVRFPNADDGYHNVFSYSKAKRFDLGRYRKDEKAPVVVFDQAGVIKLFCEIHEHMRSTILVLETPHFQKTGPDGKFKLQKLPAGKFVLKAWIDEKKVYSKDVELKDNETLTVNFP